MTCPPERDWVASAYILSCAPLLVRGERATQWRGGIAEGTPEAESQKPIANSREPRIGTGRQQPAANSP